MKNKKILLTLLPLLALASCGKIQSHETVGEIADQALQNLFERLSSITGTDTDTQYHTEFHPNDPKKYTYVEKNTSKLDRRNHIAEINHETIETYEYMSGYEATRNSYDRNSFSFKDNEEDPECIDLFVDYEASINADEPGARVAGHYLIKQYQKAALNDKNEELMNGLLQSLTPYAEEISSVCEEGLDKNYVSHSENCSFGNYIEVYYEDNDYISGYCLSTYDVYFEKLNKNDGFALTKIVSAYNYYYFENLDGSLKEEPVLFEKEELVTEFGYDDITLEVKNFEDVGEPEFPFVGFFEDETSLDQLVDDIEFEKDITEAYKDIHNDGSNIKVYSLNTALYKDSLFTFLVDLDGEFEVLGSDYYHFDSAEFEKVEGSPNVIKCLKDAVYNIIAIADASTNKLLEIHIVSIGESTY